MKSLVVFCGREFLSASENVSKLLASRPNIVTRIVEQNKVIEHLRDPGFDKIIAVPLMYKITADVMDKSPKLACIQQWGVGLEGVDVDAASAKGIPVANTPSKNVTAVSSAEQTVRLLLDAARTTSGHPHTNSQSENWGGPRGIILFSKRVGIVGHKGAVGSRVARILRDGFGMNVVGIGRSEKPLGALLSDMPPLDALIMATPVTPQTRGMVNDDVFRALNRGALVVNIGRGPLVDRASVERALEADPEMRFATDVWWEEPPMYTTDSLMRHPRVVISPHIGGMTKEGSKETDERCAQGIIDFANGIMPQFAINKNFIREKTVLQIGPHVSEAKKEGSVELHSQIHPPLLPRPRADQTQAIVRELKKIVSSLRITTNPTELLKRGTDESLHEGVPPDVCVMPETTEEVSNIMQLCTKFDYPVVGYGRGTSLEGGVAALAGGLCIDMSLMNKVLMVNNKDFECLVQAGVTRLQLNQELRSTGLFFPVDPGADATLGGMASTRASGTTAVRYGTMRDRVMGLKVVLPNGNVVRTGGRALKSSAGYDLTGLFVGSEGTLGIVTEVRLRLAPTPEATCSAVAQFKDVDSAVNTVIELKQLGIPIARAEFLDEITMRAVRQAGFSSPVHDKDMPSLFLEFHGTPSNVKEQSEIARSVAGDGMVSYQEATQEEERSKLWKARHNAYYSVLKLRPAGTRGLPTDVCVPISRLAECIIETYDDVQRSNLIAPIFGHVGDGNFHCILLYNKELDGEAGLSKLQSFNERLVIRALKMEGTCTGEHGVAYGKKRWLAVEHGESAVSLMRSVKDAVDPNGIMNPGKLF